MFKEGAKCDVFTPILQIIDASQVKHGINIIISDSSEFTQALLRDYPCSAQEVIELKFKIIKLNNYQINTSNSWLVMLIFDIDILCDPQQLIGNPNKVEYKSEATQVKNIVYTLEDRIANHQDDLVPSIMMPDNDNLYAPISALCATTSDWTIKARATQKSAIRTFSNARNEGKFFKCVLVDSRGDEIQATFFNSACDKFFDIVHQGKVYSFSGGTVKGANMKYMNCNNDYEITFDKNSKITEVPDNGKIITIKYNFIPIDYLPKCRLSQNIDVCGIVINLTPAEKIMSKRGEELIRRNLTITDHTEASIEVTLWGNNALLPEFERLDLCEKPIVAFKNVKLTEFNTLSLSSDRDSTIVSFDLKNNPDIESLIKWKRQKEVIYPSTPLSERKTRNAKFATTAEMKKEWTNPLIMNKTDLFRVIGNLGLLKLEDDRLIYYEACTNLNCKKKVIRDSYGRFNCDTCNKSSDICNYRFLANLMLIDCTGSIYVTGYDETMTELLKCSAAQFCQILTNDPEAADKMTSEIFGKPINAIIKALPSDNKSGYKFSIKKLEKYDYRECTNILLKEIKTVIGHVGLN